MLISNYSTIRDSSSQALYGRRSRPDISSQKLGIQNQPIHCPSTDKDFCKMLASSGFQKPHPADGN